MCHEHQCKMLFWHSGFRDPLKYFVIKSKLVKMKITASHAIKSLEQAKCFVCVSLQVFNLEWRTSLSRPYCIGPTPTGLTLNWKCGLVLARKKCDWKVFTCSKVGVYLCNKTAVLTTFQSVSLLTYFFHFVVIKNKTCFRRSRDSVGKYNKSKKIHYLVERKMWCSK